ncbi:DUF1275 family protein [Streptomyces torulosus]|uniref:DUF1275 family protein n=1 Tax=Streptomyces torulosus TaxID=68276 RepID=UPI000ACCDF8C|nr:YoaK family protein [Streptomyces torulosus]
MPWARARTGADRYATADPGGTPAGAPRERRFVVLALLLTTVTGVVDAVSLLALDGVFSANMTGNVVMSAVGGAGVREVPVTAVAGALLGFLLGVALTARFLRAGASAVARCSGHSTVVLRGLGGCVRSAVSVPAPGGA